MADFAKCRGVGCDQRQYCLRYTAQPSQQQTYFTLEPMEGPNECDYVLRAAMAKEAK